MCRTSFLILLYPALATSTEKLAISFSSVGEKYGLGPGLLPCKILPEIRSCNAVFGTSYNHEARSTGVWSSLTASTAACMALLVHCFHFLTLREIAAAAEFDQGLPRPFFLPLLGKVDIL